MIDWRRRIVGLVGSRCRGLLPAVVIAALALSSDLGRVATEAGRDGTGDPQITPQARVPAVLVTFEFIQARPTKAADVIVQFSNAPVRRSAPRELGCGSATDGLTFSFSRQPFAQAGPVRLSQRVGNQAFLTNRYIRVVNCSDTPWEPSTLSMWVGGRPVLSGARMLAAQFKGSAASRGLACASGDCRYWEAEFQRLRTGTGR